MGSAAQGLASELLTTLGNTQQAHAEFDTLSISLGLTKAKADQLWASVSGLAGAINSLHSKTIDINVVTNSISTGGGPPVGVRPNGYASGTPAARPGWSWVGEAGPELVKFRGGETVVPNHALPGYANGAGSFGGEQHIHVYIDGRQVYGAVSKQAVTTQRRTGHNGMTKRTR